MPYIRAFLKIYMFNAVALTVCGTCTGHLNSFESSQMVRVKPLDSNGKHNVKLIKYLPPNVDNNKLRNRAYPTNAFTGFLTGVKYGFFWPYALMQRDLDRYLKN